ncbi:MAG: PSD1 and planctomycete cytochrome C domain-containing protein [Planctomycetota bacterium]|nr:PSD1 and planctomycete cytochrome C domain-containing protein [Planctomycetota bacterium]
MFQIGTFWIRLSLACLATLAVVFPARAENSSNTKENLEFFEKSVRPLLVEHCYSCHSVKAEKLQAGLRVDSRAALLKGGESGEALVPGDIDKSLLISSVRYESYEMPPKGKLPAKDIETLERWVEMDAPWPDEKEPEVMGSGDGLAPPVFDLEKRKADHWAWQPLQSSQAPEVANKSWPRSELDHFILARLEDAKLTPAPDAEKSALLRRLYFDLVGVPPTLEQSSRFLDDVSPMAMENMVDELLASPQFGERWGRHWLDLVRYAESRGHEFDNDAPNAYQYRDYVIRALNADVPYDQFVTEHIAGDLIEKPRLHPEKGFNESILGTGFWFLGEWVHSPVDIRKDESDRFDNMIDVMSKAFLGVTVACARCHDHKFDAISTADYYSLAGFLQSSDYRQVNFESLERNQHIAKELGELDAKYQKLVDGLLSEKQIQIPKVGASNESEQAKKHIVFDYAKVSAQDYLQDGYIFGSKPRILGEPYLEVSDSGPVIRFASRAGASSDPFWNGLETLSEKGTQDKNRLATLPRSGRTLRTPTFELREGTVACRVRGSGHVVACVDSHRLIAGPLHGETIKSFKSSNEWIELKLQRYIGHRLHLEFTPEVGEQIDVSLIVQGASKESREQLVAYEKEHETLVEQLEASATAASKEKLNDLANSWAKERGTLQSKLMLQSNAAMAMLDGSGEDEHILIRGNSSKPGKVEPRHFLTAIVGNKSMDIPSGSGRLELARQINSPSNPLSHRVIVNRIWHHLMGRGIVPTTDDFGVLGQRPTHPELLDYLAIRFMADGQSLKRIIRFIVLSRTYQMSSKANADGLASDPKNLLWHYRPPKRLEGEAIRDALLQVSGELDPLMFGEPIPVHLTTFMDGRGRPKESGPLDGARRRSIYLAVRRNFLSPFMLAFDTPSPFSSMGRRNVSNVPAQALILMNDPFVVQQSQKWAEHIVARPISNDSRIEEMYRAAFTRFPTSGETKVALDFLSSRRSEGESSDVPVEVWADFSHALINTKEFIFLP